MDEDRQLNKKERREIKREEREAARSQGVARERTRKVIASLVILVLLALFVWLFWPARGDRNASTANLGQDYSREIPYQGADHITVGSKHDPYNSNPPTSGPHWPDPVRDGIYDKSQPDEGLVHSLEHGRIWISYRSSIPDAIKTKIEELAKKEYRVVVTVRDQNDTDIALAAWQRLDAFNLPSDGILDEGRISDFIKRYRDKGPEFVPGMTGKEY